eukprot:5594798-Alexandrium_andersonii.AAC.1
MRLGVRGGSGASMPGAAGGLPEGGIGPSLRPAGTSPGVPRRQAFVGDRRHAQDLGDWRCPGSPGPFCCAS